MDGWNEAVIRVILVKLEWSWPEVNKQCISSRQKKMGQIFFLPTLENLVYYSWKRLLP